MTFIDPVRGNYITASDPLIITLIIRAAPIGVIADLAEEQKYPGIVCLRRYPPDMLCPFPHRSEPAIHDLWNWAKHKANEEMVNNVLASYQTSENERKADETAL